jgi:hypothetical protein
MLQLEGECRVSYLFLYVWLCLLEGGHTCTFILVPLYIKVPRISNKQFLAFQPNIIIGEFHKILITIPSCITKYTQAEEY